MDEWAADDAIQAAHELGLLSFDDGRYDDAIRHFIRMLELRPGFAMRVYGVPLGLGDKLQQAGLLPELPRLLRGWYGRWAPDKLGALDEWLREME